MWAVFLEEIGFYWSIIFHYYGGKGNDCTLTLTGNLQGTKNKNLGVLLSKNLREAKINGFLDRSTSLKKPMSGTVALAVW